MKKSKYISKYDYLGYYSKQPAMWFYSNDEIQAAINVELNQYSQLSLDDDDELDDEDEEYEVDAYEYYKAALFDRQDVAADWDQKEYEEYLVKHKEVDQNNILIVQGNILDKWSKEHIRATYSSQGCQIIDYDDQQYRYKNVDSLAEITKQDFEQHDKLIMFQPTFIWQEKGLITKCDALVKLHNDIYIIETKGTSSTKLVHVFDLYYQHKVVEHSLQEYMPDNTFLYNYRLCIIDYVKAPKFTAPFVITDSCGLGKSPTATPANDKSFQTKRNVKLGIRVNEKFDHTAYFDDIFTWTMDSINEAKEDGLISTQEYKVRTKVVELLMNFNDAIRDLKTRKNYLLEVEKHKPNVKPEKFVPSFQDKGLIKNTDYWVDLKKLYIAKGYDLFAYSGNLLKIKPEIMSSLKPHMSAHDLFMVMKDHDIKYEKQAEEYEASFAAHLPAFKVNQEAWNYHLSLLKDKKVYFDFESINTAVRAVDNSTPFLQAITQCSIIKDHHDGTPISDAPCLNMCCHPKQIDNNWMKSVIDELYEGPDYSYIVYNKNFEKSRLKEMAEFINEPEYTKKVECINDNIVDLAEWYNYKGKKNSTNPKDKNARIECPILVKQLHGFYSIKKVLPLVNLYNPAIYNETKCVSYVDGLLTVHNGTECQTQTTKYFYDMETDQTWDEFLASIQCYCENDVRAMIAVEYLAKEIAKNPQYYNDLAKKLGY